MDKELEKVLKGTICENNKCVMGILTCKYYIKKGKKCRKMIELISQIKSLAKREAKKCVPKGAGGHWEKVYIGETLTNINQKFK